MIKIAETKKEDIPKVRSVSKLFKGSHISEIDLKPPNWLVYDFIEQNTVSLFFGDSGSHKSFIALDVACCIGSGNSYHDLQLKQAPILYLAAEGRGGIRKRIAAWELVNEIDITKYPIYIPERFILLDTDEGKKELFDALQYDFWPDVAETHPSLEQQSFVIFVDTLAKSMVGDEDQTKEMNKILDTCRELQQEYNCTVILIHHTGHSKKDRPRGAYTLIGGVDASYRVETVKDKTITKFISQKLKDDEEPDTLTFKKKVIDLGIKDDRGKKVTSLIMKRIESDSESALGFKTTSTALVIKAMQSLNGFAKLQKELIQAYQEVNKGETANTNGAIKNYINKACKEGYLEIGNTGTRKNYTLIINAC